MSKSTVTMIIPEVIPKYIPLWKEYANTRKGVTATMSEKIVDVFELMETSWPDYVKRYGKKRVKKTPEQNAVINQKKIQTQIKKKDFWQTVAQSPDQEPEVRRIAKRKVEQITAAENKKDQPAAPVLTVQDLEADGAEDEEESSNHPYVPHADFMAPQFHSTPREQSTEEEESSVKRRKVETSEEEDVLFGAQKEEPELEKVVMKKNPTAIRVIGTPRRNNTLKKALGKKVTVTKLETTKKQFYKMMHEHGIGGDEGIAKLFDEIYNTALEQNDALNCVNSLIQDSFE